MECILIGQDCDPLLIGCLSLGLNFGGYFELMHLSLPFLHSLLFSSLSKSPYLAECRWLCV